MTVTVRPARRDDFDGIATLNAADVHHLSPLTLADVARLSAIAFRFTAAESEGRLAGFLLALSEDAPYESVNFRWFKERYPRFVYVDRVVVGAHARRGGVATSLYDDLTTHGLAHGAPLIACEINLRPDNPGSIAFHERLGFAPVGAQVVANGAKTVSMRIKTLSTR